MGGRGARGEGGQIFPCFLCSLPSLCGRLNWYSEKCGRGLVSRFAAAVVPMRRAAGLASSRFPPLCVRCFALRSVASRPASPLGKCARPRSRHRLVGLVSWVCLPSYLWRGLVCLSPLRGGRARLHPPPTAVRAHSLRWCVAWLSRLVSRAQFRISQVN